VQHIYRSKEFVMTLRAVGQKGLMCSWLFNEVSSQVYCVRNGRERLAKGKKNLNEPTRQTEENVLEQETTMQQMAAYV
ncbi:hypothetical protein AIZ12_25870, partial [Salmonella enterica subsp. enterica serovar Typhimurium]